MNKKAFAWALYDFANTIFSMNVVSLYFPLLISIDFALGDFWVGVANSLSMFIAAVILPIFGTYSDLRGGKLTFLFFTTIFTVLGTAGIGFSAKTEAVSMAIVSFVVANASYQISMGFYNTFLEDVSFAGTRGRISGLGAAFGYLGSIVGLLLISPFNTGKFFGKPVSFISTYGRASTFLPTALLVLIFSAPMFFALSNWHIRKTGLGFSKYIAVSLSRLKRTISQAGKFRGARRFFLAKFFFDEGIQAGIIFMGIYAEKVMGLSDPVKVVFFVVATTGAVLGSVLCGFLNDRFGAKRILLYALFGWVLMLVLLVLAKTKSEFIVIGIAIGMLLGSVWTSSRPLLIQLVPKEMLGQFFGLFGLVGRTAAVVGPLVWNLALKISSHLAVQMRYKIAVLSLALLILIGSIILLGVQVDGRSRGVS